MRKKGTLIWKHMLDIKWTTFIKSSNLNTFDKFYHFYSVWRVNGCSHLYSIFWHPYQRRPLRRPCYSSPRNSKCQYHSRLSFLQLSFVVPTAVEEAMVDLLWLAVELERRASSPYPSRRKRRAPRAGKTGHSHMIPYNIYHNHNRGIFLIVGRVFHARSSHYFIVKCKILIKYYR